MGCRVWDFWVGAHALRSTWPGVLRKGLYHEHRVAGAQSLEYRVKVELNPHPVMGTTRDYCRYMKALLTPYSGATTVGWINPKFKGFPKNHPPNDAVSPYITQWEGSL